jgi:hypothetical protein
MTCSEARGTCVLALPLFLFLSEALHRTLTLSVTVILSQINFFFKKMGNNRNISFVPAIVSTITRMHGDFLRLLFLQVLRET